MLLPQTYGAALSLIVLTMFCWGSWANTFKLAGKWRFELFYYDYSLGVLIAAAIYALTFGNLGHDGLAFKARSNLCSAPIRSSLKRARTR